MKRIIVLLLLTQSGFLYAQSDLLKMLSDSMGKAKSELVIATFKGTRVVSAQSNETLKPNNLDFRIAHRFGNIGSQSGGNIHSLYGLYSSSDIFISFEYGISNRLMAGFSSSKMHEELQGLIKYKTLIQTTDDKIPISVTLFANSVITPEKAFDIRYDKLIYRLSYCYQVILARKITRDLSIEIIPVLLHRNFVLYQGDENDLFSLGAAGRYKFSRSSSIITEYFYTFSKFRRSNKETPYYAPFSIGYEVETGGHTFSIMLSNSPGILENDFIVNTTDAWQKGGMKLGFSISRVFALGDHRK